MNDNPTSGQLIKQFNDAVERRANNSLRQNDLTMVQVWVLLSLNEKCCQEATQSIKKLEQTMFHGLSEEEQTVFHSLLQRIYENMK